jgi:hypothetical protein
MSNCTAYYVEHLQRMAKSLTPPHRKKFLVDLGMHIVAQDAIIEAQRQTIEALGGHNDAKSATLAEAVAAVFCRLRSAESEAVNRRATAA